jgi:dephospho-CoA kinase
MADNKIYIGLVGEAGSGKDTVANILERKYKARILTSSHLLKKALGIYLDKIGRKDYIWFVKELTKKYGNDVISKAMLKNMKKFKDKIVVFNGVRLPSDYQVLKEIDSDLIYITAKAKLRWKRSIGRNEKADDGASFEEFLSMHQKLTEVNVPKIGQKADYRIVNDGTLDDLERKITEIITDIVKKKKN